MYIYIFFMNLKYNFQLAQKPIPLNRVQVLLYIYAIFSFWYASIIFAFKHIDLNFNNQCRTT